MSQFAHGTIDPAVKTGTQLAADLSSAEGALLSTHKANSVPSYVEAGQFWLNDTVGTAWVINFYDGTNSVSLFNINTSTHVASLAVGIISVTGDVDIGGNLDLTTNGATFENHDATGLGRIYMDGTGKQKVSGVIGVHLCVNDVAKASCNTLDFSPVTTGLIALGTASIYWGSAFLGKTVVRNGASGSTASNQADSLVVHGSGNMGLSLLAPDLSTASLYFGTATDSAKAYLIYNDTANTFTIASSVAGDSLILQSGNSVTACTFDSAQDATFVGDVTLTTGNVSAVAGTFTGDVTLSGTADLQVGSNQIKFNATDDPHRIQFWSSSTAYSIGMGNGASGYTYGALNGYAIVTTMNAGAEGWLWRIAAHTDAQGSMSLDGLGNLAVLNNVTLTAGNMTVTAGDILFTATTGNLIFPAGNQVSKVKWWADNISYGIGMSSGYTYGDSTTHNTLFNMSSGTQGFLWRNSGHTTAQGAMFLKSAGQLQVLGQIRNTEIGAPTGTTGAVNWDLDVNPKAAVTLTGNITITPTLVKNNSSGTITITNDGVGRTVSWGANVKWAGGTAPTLSGINKVYVVSLFCYNGTNLVGAVISDIS